MLVIVFDLLNLKLVFMVQIFTDAGQYVIRFGSSDSGVVPAAEVIHRTSHISVLFIE